jgi:polyvinyl alcohol dehydrogenase (cytochrome)
MHLRLGFVAVAICVIACKSSDQTTGPVVVAPMGGAPAAGTVAPAAGGGTGGTGGTAGTAGAAGTGVSTGGKTGDVPCPVATVLKQHCVQCHGNTLREGAPVSLVNAANFHRDAGGQLEGAAVLARVRSAERPMPPPPAAPLTAAEIATLDTWITPGAAPASPGCVVDDSPVMPAAGTGGVTIVNPGTGGSGGAAGAPGPTAESENWSAFGVDLANSRNNASEKTLTVDNVKGLKELWTFKGASTTSTPAVVDGVVYLPSWDGKVNALKLDDGTTVWTTTLPDLIDSSPTVTATQVFVSDDNGSVHALDRATGKVQWSKSVDPHAEAHLWSSPVFIPDANLIVIGVASGEEQVMAQTYTFRGGVVGLDATTGNQKWRFDTASSAKGSGPGVAVWGTAAIDTKRKLAYIGTGNNYQAPAGEYADSMLAINYETGMLLWSTQFTKEDIFTVYGMTGPDADIGSSGNLFTVDGKDLLGIGVKTGNYYALDRDTGAIVWMRMVTGGSALGGILSASAYANGMIFVASNTSIGGPLHVVALNAKDGTIAWMVEHASVAYGGVAHANGVVYVGTNGGDVLALDGAKGTMLWIDQTPDKSPIGGGPTVSHGRLLLPWGYTWTLREGVTGTGGLTVYGL